MKMRKLLKITSRTSSITNGFVQAILPSIEPTIDEMREALSVLGMTPENKTCVYCGSFATEWDHFRPLVQYKKPTGYIHEIRNLVPSCGPCNQSKSGANWLTWMRGSARGSPNSKNVPDLEVRIARLAAFETWGNVSKIPFMELVGEDEWADFWALLTDIEARLHDAQRQAVMVREKITTKLKSTKH